MKLPTVKIKHDDGFCIINQKDFDNTKHQLYVEGQQDSSETNEQSDRTPALVNLNTATQKVLVDLPSVGSTRAKFIIDNRPYKSIDDAKAKLTDLNWVTVEPLVEV